MNAWVLLLDAIEGTRTRKLAPSALRKLLKGLGVRQIKTAPPSGDAVFCGVIDARAFGGYVADMIAHHLGARPRTLVLSRDSFTEITDLWPWAGAPNNPEDGQVWFLHRPSSASLAALRAAAAPGERFTLTPSALYHHAPDGFAQSPLVERAERLLNVPAHRRDLDSIARLHAMLAGLRED